MKKSRIPTVPQALLIYFSVLFFWHFAFSFVLPQFNNVDYLKYSTAAVSIYLIAKASLEPDFLGRSIRISDTVEITFLWVVLVLTGVGAWGLLVYLDAAVNGDLAVEHWGLVSQQKFNQMQWSLTWIIADLLTVSFLNVITEEIVFRVFVLRRLRERYSLAFSVIASAALFGAFHFNKSFIGAFLNGLVFAIVVIRMPSVYASILLHGLYNATVFALRIFFGLSIVGEPKMLSSAGYWVPEFLCGIVGLALLAVYFFSCPFPTQAKAANQLTLNSNA